MRVRLAVAAALIAAPAVVVTAVLAQPSVAPSSAQALPPDINGYTRWTKMNFKPIASPGGEAHQGVKNVYVNLKRKRLVTRAGKQRYPYPVGTVVVKNARRGGFIWLVAVGRKKKSGPHNGWEFVEYSRSSASDTFDEVARGQVCYSCHIGAIKTDYIFTKVREGRP